MCNSPNQSQATNIPWWKESSLTTAFSTIAGVVIGAALTIGANYWITYKGIEEPKIELEKAKAAIELKKASIEAHKQALSLTPTVSTHCNSNPINAWTLRVSCNSKNTGLYHATVKISDVALSVNTDISETKYSSGSHFSVEYPNNKSMFLVSPASDGDLWFYIKFDANKYPSGANIGAVVARVSVDYETIVEARDFVVTQFPELKDIVSRVAKSKTEFFVYPINKLASASSN